MFATRLQDYAAAAPPHGRRIKNRMFVLSLVAFAGSIAALTAAPAGKEVVFEPPDGLWLLAGDFSGRLYGPTSTRANWAVAQWDIPRELPPFVRGVTKMNTPRLRSSEMATRCGKTLKHCLAIKYFSLGDAG